ncbi:deoxyribonuclease V [Rapidithrix thailandica]|uniref:Endonuclease V n=1 Tax=Rapidithrix thailandica TaxID=413964 RepID=A0AAW9RZK6_9BACT
MKKNTFDYQKWQNERKYFQQEGVKKEELELEPFFNIQEDIKKQILTEGDPSSEVKFIAGVDVAYNEVAQRVVAGLAILDAITLECVETAICEDRICFPYIPGLFSFREIPPILKAFEKLRIQPDLIVCDGQGMAHPKGVGMACHLGIELQIPSIGCAKSRLIGEFEAPGEERGASTPLLFEGQEVGKVVRTQTEVKPVFVSVGHMISLETACQWVLRLSPNYRLPETTRAADHLVNQTMKQLF